MMSPLITHFPFSWFHTPCLVPTQDAEKLKFISSWRIAIMFLWTTLQNDIFYISINNSKLLLNYHEQKSWFQYTSWVSINKTYEAILCRHLIITTFTIWCICNPRNCIDESLLMLLYNITINNQKIWTITMWH